MQVELTFHYTFFICRSFWNAEDGTDGTNGSKFDVLDGLRDGSNGSRDGSREGEIGDFVKCHDVVMLDVGTHLNLLHHVSQNAYQDMRSEATKTTEWLHHDTGKIYLFYILLILIRFSKKKKMCNLLHIYLIHSFFRMYILLHIYLVQQ